MIVFYPNFSSTEFSSFAISKFLGAVSLIFILHVLAKTRYTLPLTILLGIIIIINAYFSFVLTTNFISLGIIASMIESDVSEAVTVLGGRILPILIIVVLTTSLIYLALRELKVSALKRRVSVLIVFFYAFSLLPVLTLRRILLTNLRFQFHSLSLFYTQLVVNEYSPLLYGNVATLVSYVNEVSTLKQAFQNERKIKDGMTINTELSDSLKVSKIYLVVGESATRAHMSLYDYSVKTTPFLDSLSYVDSVNMSYYYALTGATLTRNSVPMILGTSSAHDRTAFSREKTLLDLANESGYETFWLSNQPRVDSWDIQMGSFISRLSQMSQNLRHLSPAYGEDFDVLSALKEVHEETDRPQLFVLHITGSHETYSDRYDEIDEDAINGEGVVVDYDRSIYHTDRFLQRLYNEVMSKDQSSLLIYMSDHGEDIGVGHGFTMTKTQFKVPLVTINNSLYSIDSVVAKYLDQQVWEAETEYNINTGSIMYIVSDVLGYTISDDLVEQVIDDGRSVYHRDEIFSYKEIFEQKNSIED